MEQVADENPSASQQPENVDMEQADYDPDSDDDSDEEGHPPAGRPTSKAMPHPKLVPKSPPPALRLVSKVKPAQLPRPTLQGEGPHTEKQYMDFIKRVYSICCYTNAQSKVYGTDIIPMVCHNGNSDLEKTVQNVEQVCKYFRMDPSKAKQITDLILWRIERMSRSLSGWLRHDPRHGTHKECRRQVDMGPDGSVELYDALTCVTHARNFIRNKPGLLLMAMFPSYGKSRLEIAFVFPFVDGSYKERKARGEIVPRNRWIEKLNTRSAQDALWPDGKEFYVDPEMEFYVRCNSGHTRQVEIQSFGRPLYSEQQREPQHDEPDYDFPTESIPPSPHPSRSEAPHEDEGTAQPKHRMRRPAPPPIEEERKIKPFAKKPITFMFHATYGNQLLSIMENGLKSGKSQSNPSGSTWHALMTSSLMTMSQKQHYPMCQQEEMHC